MIASVQAETAAAAPPHGEIHFRHRWSGDTLWRGQAPSIGAALNLLSRMGARLHGIDLRQADLSGGTFNGVRLIEADLSGADLRETTWAKSTLNGCILDRVWAGSADFSHASLRGVTFERADVAGTQFHFADLTGARFPDALASTANFTNAQLNESCFQGAALQAARFHCADMDEADLSRTLLERADFTGASLQLANLRDSHITLEQLRAADFTIPQNELCSVLTNSAREAWAVRQALLDRTTEPTLLETVLRASGHGVIRGPRPLNFWAIEILWDAMYHTPRDRASQPIAALLAGWIDQWHTQLAGAFDGQPWPKPASWPVATIHDQAALDAARM